MAHGRPGPSFFGRRYSVLYRHFYDATSGTIYGIELPYSVSVGRRVVIEHQSGIVIHGASVIGDECIIRQNCTLGVRRVDRPDRSARSRSRGRHRRGRSDSGPDLTIGDFARDRGKCGCSGPMFRRVQLAVGCPRGSRPDRSSDPTSIASTNVTALRTLVEKLRTRSVRHYSAPGSSSSGGAFRTYAQCSVPSASSEPARDQPAALFVNQLRYSGDRRWSPLGAPNCQRFHQ